MTTATLIELHADVQLFATVRPPCHVYDPEVWFAETPEGVEHAKSLCRSCPVQLQCLEGALDRREPWGVWGGELFVQGVVVPRKRPRGRPRKDESAA
jgi:WhiB family redox-sensing transcriptional regulator